MEKAQTMMVPVSVSRLPELLRSVLAVSHPLAAVAMEHTPDLAFVPEYASGEVLLGGRRYLISGQEVAPDRVVVESNVPMYGFGRLETHQFPFVTEVGFATGDVALRFVYAWGAVKAWLTYQSDVESVLRQRLAAAMCTNGPIMLSEATPEDVALLQR